jgi:hypothetical protein
MATTVTPTTAGMNVTAATTMLAQRRVGTRTRLTASIDRFSGGSTRAHEPLRQNPTLDKRRQFAKNTRCLLGARLASKGHNGTVEALTMHY